MKEQAPSIPFDHNDLLTADEVAAMLKVKPSWVYERIRHRKGLSLPHIKLGHYVRFERRAVEQFVRRQRRSYVGFEVR